MNKGVRRAIRHHRKTDCCCFCLKTDLGVKIIGVGLCLTLLEESKAPNMFRAGLKIAMLVPFFMMLYKDSAFNRQLLLYLFCLCTPLIAIVNLIAYQNILADNAVFANEVCWVSKMFAGEAKDEDGNDCADNDNEDECLADQD